MSERHGEELGLSLSELMGVGVESIPELAGTYGQAATLFSTTATNSSDAFNMQQNASMGATKSRIYPSWLTLRDQIQDLFAQSQANLNETASTVVEVVNSYARQDEEAAQALRDSAKTTYPDLPPVGYGENPVNPPVLGTPNYSTENNDGQ